MSAPPSPALRAVAALDDPTRRALYGIVRAGPGPVTRERAAAAAGISRKLAAFHLDKLVDAGLLTAGYDRANRSRTVGRAPKAYRLADLQVSISIPDRRPGALAELLLHAIDAARPGESPRDAALRVAHESGQALGAVARSTVRGGRLGPERALALAREVLRERGYEPVQVSHDRLRLRNCPYQSLAADVGGLVCQLNHRLLTGFLDGLRTGAVEAVLVPRPPECCVELRPSADRSA